ncbi:MAG TPA: hypothetical protein PKA10_01945 [Selenomonadales bacterium]|nr:hypothetical protein [Selenomonadales bacterium]
MAEKDPYAAGKFTVNPYAAKRDVTGTLAVVLDGKMEDRGLELIRPISRCLRKYEIHELILTDEVDAKPGSAVNRIAYLGFVELEQGGVVVSGDKLLLDGEIIGTLAGFDETHMPNHLNIVVKTDRLATGAERGAGLGLPVRFTTHT